MSPEELAEIARQRSAFMPSPQLLHKLVEMGFSLGKVPSDSARVMNDAQPSLSFSRRDQKAALVRSGCVFDTAAGVGDDRTRAQVMLALRYADNQEERAVVRAAHVVTRPSTRCDRHVSAAVCPRSAVACARVRQYPCCC
jgi:hypothetical protein